LVSLHHAIQRSDLTLRDIVAKYFCVLFSISLPGERIEEIQGT
tara:strand:+ start:646 stop:774 length:129 start_codon:yes stop_codon:yes gene_type:complete